MRTVVVGVVMLLGCEKKSTEKEERFEGPMPVRFGDCASTETAWLSGPRPAALAPETTKVAAADTKPTDDPPPPEEDDPPAPPKAASAADAQAARKEAIEQARAAGIIGVTATTQGGAFATLTGTGDISSGFDDSDIYGGLLGDQGELNGGFGIGTRGTSPGGGGTGWGTIGTGRYGTIGHGSGTGGYGYGVAAGRGGMRARSSSVPTVSIGQPNAQGDLDKAIIRRYFKRNIQKIQYCYEKQLLVTPAIQGTITTEFFITPNGAVASAKAEGVHPEVASCVASVIKSIEFPKPKGGGGVQVVYPFTFRPAEGTATAGSATAPATGAPPAPPRKLLREPGPVDMTYVPGASNPLRAEESAVTECFRKGAARHGAIVVELRYDDTGKTGGMTVHGSDDERVLACLANVAKKTKRITPAVTAERCSIAFGDMPSSTLPVVEVTADAITFGGKALDKEALGAAIEARVKAATAAQGPVIQMYGPLVLRPAATTPMKSVTPVIAAILRAGDDFVLASGDQLLEPMALPVVPVPFGTGSVWNHVKGRSGFGDGDPKPVLSLVVHPGDKIDMKVSQVGEQQSVPQGTLAASLKAHKASTHFANRTDIEIAANGDVTYGALVAAVIAARDAGFTSWQLTDPPRE